MSSNEIQRLHAGLNARYSVTRELGRGGMAIVYLADDVRHGREVAIKVLHSELSHAVGLDRFQREIQVAARLTHPHIVPLFDSGETDGLLFYVMPYIPGESLRKRLDREKELPVDDALRITRQVASALDYSHAQGLIHRDVKPENILLHEGQAIVTDFGIALAASENSQERLTAAGYMVGTAHYMSPEQASGDRVLDASSDIYSLACVLYEMLAGEPPYTGNSAQAVMAKRFTDPVPRLRRLRPAVPAGIERAITKALSLVPADRFKSGGSFVKALSQTVAEGPDQPSVAVLPFLNLSTDPENEFFADGITEDVIAQLSKIRALKVISRTSVMPFRKREHSVREIGEALHASAILDGSVRRAGSRVRIVAQLIDAKTDQHLWTDTYDRQLTDIFAVQSEVALQIGAALAAELSPDERSRIQKQPTRNLHAYQLYLQGRQWYVTRTEEGLGKAINSFRQAVAHDPEYAMAHVGLAYAHAEIGIGGGGLLSPDLAYGRARESVARALELDASLGDAHSVLAVLAFTCDYDWVRAERELLIALDLNPSSADTYDYYGWLCAAQERHDEAVAMVRRAQELDPLAHRTDLASTLLRAGRLDEALEAATHAVEIDSEYSRGRSVLGWAYLKTGRQADGLAELEKAVELSPDHTMFIGQLGEAYGIAGQPDKARDVLRQLHELKERRYVSPYHMAYVYAGLNEQETAIDLLEQAYVERASGIYGVRGSFLFESLRAHPRFRTLLGKMNLA